MAGLTDRAGGMPEDKRKALEHARRSWEESMVRQIESLRGELAKEAPEMLADRCAGHFTEETILLPYWGQEVSIHWPGMEATLADGQPCSTFDTAMLLYYLHHADGALPADRWISYREIPGGAFYHQAFQGYSGNRISKAFGDDFTLFEAAARRLDGFKLTALAEHAFAFQPLPRIRLAAVLWPGDEDFPTRASVLFDAASHHYMTIDGLALLGSGLASRLVRASIDLQSPS
jgi:hypothetical protein